MKKLAAVQTSAVPTGSNSGSRCLVWTPSATPPFSQSTHVLFTQQTHREARTHAHKKSNFTFCRFAPGSVVEHKKIKTASVYPQLGTSLTRTERLAAADTAGTSSSTLGHKQRLRRPSGRSAAFFPSSPRFLPPSRNHFRRFFPLGYPPPRARCRSNHHIPPRP